MSSSMHSCLSYYIILFHFSDIVFVGIMGDTLHRINLMKALVYVNVFSLMSSLNNCLRFHLFMADSHKRVFLFNV